MEKPVRQKEQITFKYIGGLEDRSDEKTSMSHYTYKGYSVVKISVREFKNGYSAWDGVRHGIDWGHVKDGYYIGGNSTKKEAISNLNYMEEKGRL